MSAIISDCGLYRYRLDRNGLSGNGHVVWIMVNPSTADATQDDATIRRVRGFSERKGFARFTVGNLFAYRATDVRELRSARDPIGPDNDQHLRDMLTEANAAYVAWGPVAKVPDYLRRRFWSVVRMSREIGQPLWCLGTVKDGHPRHPLMLPNDAEAMQWLPPQ